MTFVLIVSDNPVQLEALRRISWSEYDMFPYYANTIQLCRMICENQHPALLILSDCASALYANLVREFSSSSDIRFILRIGEAADSVWRGVPSVDTFPLMNAQSLAPVLQRLCHRIRRQNEARIMKQFFDCGSNVLCLQKQSPVGTTNGVGLVYAIAMLPVAPKAFDRTVAFPRQTECGFAYLGAYQKDTTVICLAFQPAARSSASVHQQIWAWIAAAASAIPDYKPAPGNPAAAYFLLDGTEQNLWVAMDACRAYLHNPLTNFPCFTLKLSDIHCDGKMPAQNRDEAFLCIDAAVCHQRNRWAQDQLRMFFHQYARELTDAAQLHLCRNQLIIHLDYWIALSGILDRDYMQALHTSLIQCRDSTELIGATHVIFEVLSNGQKDHVNRHYSESTCRVLSHVAQNYLKDIELWQLADMLRISTSYLCRTFKADTGVTIIQYQTDLRIKQAACLLASSQIQIGYIARIMGFTSVQYFCKVFRERTGQTPTAFRKYKNYARATGQTDIGGQYAEQG